MRIWTGLVSLLPMIQRTWRIRRGGSDVEDRDEGWFRFYWMMTGTWRIGTRVSLASTDDAEDMEDRAWRIETKVMEDRDETEVTLHLGIGNKDTGFWAGIQAGNTIIHLHPYGHQNTTTPPQTPRILDSQSYLPLTSVAIVTLAIDHYTAMPSSSACGNSLKDPNCVQAQKPALEATLHLAAHCIRAGRRGMNCCVTMNLSLCLPLGILLGVLYYGL